MNKLLLILIFVLVAGYFFVSFQKPALPAQNNFKNKVAQNPKKDIVSPSIPTPTPGSFKDTATAFTIADTDYMGWQTYTNTGHNYTLKYPKGWTIDTSLANVERDFLQDCCKGSALKISNGSSTWELGLDALYTGGGGLTDPSLYQQCVSSRKNMCKDVYIGPISIAGLTLYQHQLVDQNKNPIYVEFTEQGVPVFAFGPAPEREGPDGQRMGSITYSGDNLAQDMAVLDKITASVQSEGFK